jgi:hypothetical protein
MGCMGREAEPSVIVSSRSGCRSVGLGGSCIGLDGAAAVGQPVAIRAPWLHGVPCVAQQRLQAILGVSSTSPYAGPWLGTAVGDLRPRCPARHRRPRCRRRSALAAVAVASVMHTAKGSEDVV